MPRKRKTPDDQVASPDGTRNGNGSITPPTSKKKPALRRKSAPKKKAAEETDAISPQITDEAIRVRAYLIAEERARRGLPGDENSDWLEARRQLIDEMG